jgi:hypothetical protein
MDMVSYLGSRHYAAPVTYGHLMADDNMTSILLLPITLNCCYNCGNRCKCW